jgi:excisionase family DNA binding protein
MIVVDGVEMVDVREAAALAQRTPETIRRWVWSGRLPARRQGNRLLIARDDLTDTAPPEALPTLAEWAHRLPRSPSANRRHRSAADLVLADRAER